MFIILSELIIVNIILNLVLLAYSGHEPLQHHFWRTFDFFGITLESLTTFIDYLERLN